MATADIAQGFGPGTDRRFFMVMSLVVALVVLSGFGPSYASSLPPPGLPYWVHLHGAVMVAWIVLFAVQSWLVGRRSLALHRRLGWLSIGLVAVMVPLGFVTNAMAIHRGATPPFFTPAMMMAADGLDICLFLGVYAAAIRLRRNSAWHKRLMLCATILLTWPALGRLLPLRSLGLPMIIPAATALLILLALIGPAFDLATRRRVHPAYLWGVGLIAAAQPLHGLLAASPPIQALARQLLA